MRKSSSSSATYRKHAVRSPAFSMLLPTLTFLEKCHGATHDWTSTKPIKAPPLCAREAAVFSSLEDDFHTISSSQLNHNLLKSIENYFNRNDIPCKEEDIFVVSSTFEAMDKIFHNFHKLLEGETRSPRILIPTPTFGHYLQLAEDQNLNIKLLPSVEANNWKIDPSALERTLMLSKPDIFLFTNPINPTGGFYTQKEVENIAAVLKKHNVIVISDEVFKDLCFSDTEKPYSIAAVEGMFERTITLNGIAKSRGFSTLASFGCCPSALIKELKLVSMTGFPLIIQKMAAATLEDTKEMQTYLSDSIALYKEHIAFIKEHIVQLNTCLTQFFNQDKLYVKPFLEPHSTSLFSLDFSGLRNFRYKDHFLRTGLEVAEFLLREAGLAMVPGEGFLIDASRMVLRMSSAYSKEDIQKGFEAISKACEILTPPPMHLKQQGFQQPSLISKL